MAKIYIVATPIGNLEDVTYRAVRILGEVDMVLCEDTRVTKRLLDHYEIQTPTLSYHAQSGVAKVEKIFDLLDQGKDLALVSDAGTPTISDPGVQLIQQLKERYQDSVSIVPIPGPSASLAALSISGFPTAPHIFLGFLPHKKGRKTLFERIASSKETCIFYESPHRILKTLESLADVLPESRNILVARELTKLYEETLQGSPKEVLEYFKNNPDKIKGEFVVLVSA